METTEIKKALDSFEGDDFLSSKEILQKQLHQAKNDFLKSKLELKNDIEAQFSDVVPVDKKNITRQRILTRKKQTGGE